MNCEIKVTIEHKMRRFALIRINDLLGITGVGTIAEGIEFSNGSVIVHWLKEPKSIVVWNNMNDMKTINCHNGTSIVHYID